MGFLFAWEWIFWGLSNVLVTAAYFTLPLKLKRSRRKEAPTLSSRNSRLFESFILFCGLAHFLMFALMLFMAWQMEAKAGAWLCAEIRDGRGWWVNTLVWAVVVQSWTVAIVSWEAVFRLRLTV